MNLPLAITWTRHDLTREVRHVDQLRGARPDVIVWLKPPDTLAHDIMSAMPFSDHLVTYPMRPVGVVCAEPLVARHSLEHGHPGPMFHERMTVQNQDQILISHETHSTVDSQWNSKPTPISVWLANSLIPALPKEAIERILTACVARRLTL